MAASPETRPSLLVRLKDQADDEAWFEFTEIYRPVVYRLACRSGLQHADAEDLAQQVLSSVARVIGGWQNDPAKAKFRTWLHRVASNAIINALTRAKPDRGAGDSALHEQLARHPAEEGPLSDLILLERRREVFRWAARQVQAEFQPVTWQAFWLTAVEGQEVEYAMRELRLSRGALYAARSRVMRRLRERVREWEQNEPESCSPESMASVKRQSE